ncbi:adhesion G protein-coupled receptor L3-like isoform X2 [Ruditapes philippinarum]|uniref:adhesion G protein-coupled receptor L3-like isoform X2 n=1 Tax=Ruditapes philippinarum TaxID=129788 RepID=UPI00295B820F|nr:adhesion G protein-coupled receptor L3-like isoform X2 [Ruditapes philippinarum]
MFKDIVKYVILIWILSVIHLSDSSEDGNVCVPPWETFHQSCIQFVELRYTWQEARTWCLNMDSDLLSIIIRQEDVKIDPFLYHYLNYTTINWWIGLYKVEETWIWTYNNESYSGIPKWAPDSQWNNTFSVDKCGLIEYQGYLKNMNCNVRRHFICERNKTIQLTTLTHSSPTTRVSTAPTTSTNSTASPTTTRSTTYAIPTPDIRTPSTRITESHEETPTTRKTTTILPSSFTNTTTSGITTQSTTQAPVKSTTTTGTNQTEMSSPSQSTTEKTITGITSESTAIPTTESITTEKELSSPSKSTTDYTITEKTSESTVVPTTESNTTEDHTVHKTETSTVIPITRTSSKSTSVYTTDSHTTVNHTESSTPSTHMPFTDEQTTQNTSTESQIEERDLFRGCFKINYESTCPPVEAFGFSWPRSAADTLVRVRCNSGFANWKCDTNPTCWRGEPDVKQCTSESVQELTNQMEEFLTNTSNSEKALEFTVNLAASVETESVMSEQDLFQSTKLMDAASKAKPKNSTEATSIIRNVAKCGSGLVGKTDTWTSMNKESQRSVASSLLTSMESVTNNMIESFEKPIVETIQEENMAIQLQVIDVVKNGSEAVDTIFKADENDFAIPQENLKSFSTGGLARLVFINYKSVGDYMVPTDYNTDDSTERQMISQVISASLSQKPANEPLLQPVVFTLKVEKMKPYQNITQLCSFWNFSLGHTGAWSQEGCSLKENNNSHVTCQCDHLTNFAILMDVHSTKVADVHSIVLSYITYVGIIISIICLVMSWITFVCLRSIQGERNSIHKNLAFCLFIAEVLFLFGIERTDNKIACAVIAGFLHYFFLSSFTWMFVEGIHIVFMLVQVFDAARSRLKYYYIIGYGAPLLVIAISTLVYYEGYGTDKYCWLTSERMFIWSFAGPIVFILLVNLVVLVYAMFAVCKHSEYVFTKDKSTSYNIKSWIQGALAMEVLLGLTWVFGYFYISEEAIPIAYLFTIFNSLQGLFIFVFHCLLNKKVRKAYSRFIDYPGRLTSSGTHSTKADQQNGSGPTFASYHMRGTRKHSKFLDLTDDRRPSSMSTTSA